MDIMFFIVWIILLTAIFLVGLFVGKSRTQSRLSEEIQKANQQLQESQQQLSRSEAQCELYQKQIEENKSQILAREGIIQQKEEKIQQLVGENSRIQQAYQELQQKLAEQKEEIEQISKKFVQEFENLASRILDEKSQKFTEQNSQRIGEILNPLKEKIAEFEKKVEEANKESIKNHYSLKTELEHLKQLNQQISDEAKNLASALKGESKTRGIWGELILERILELSGLEKDREYTLQESFKGEDGSRLQPDAIIYLPENKYLIIDAKVSLVAYEKYMNSEDPDEQDRALRDHVQSVRNHIDGLCNKNYSAIHGQYSPDFVFLFMPIEPAFLLALKVDKNLYEYAFNKNIIIVSPSNLLATLKVVASIWRQEKQQKNAQQIAEEAKKMLDKFYILCQRLEVVGNRIQQIQDAYDDAMITLTKGKGNLISVATRVVKLGVSPDKKLPPGFIQAADEKDEEEDERDERAD
ncbi:MAG: DNA recombination protein RmuC [Thermoflavifilum aggregans]|nr:DNA recombination protein RmuC [Thermoflavifilum aggregans]